MIVKNTQKVYLIFCGYPELGLLKAISIQEIS